MVVGYLVHRFTIFVVLSFCYFTNVFRYWRSRSHATHWQTTNQIITQHADDDQRTDDAMVVRVPRDYTSPRDSKLTPNSFHFAQNTLLAGPIVVGCGKACGRGNVGMPSRGFVGNNESLSYDCITQTNHCACWVVNDDIITYYSSGIPRHNYW